MGYSKWDVRSEDLYSVLLIQLYLLLSMYISSVIVLLYYNGLLWASAINATDAFIYIYIWECDIYWVWEYCEFRLVVFTIAGFWDVRNTEKTLPKFLQARVQ